jgi:hypothetical protein
MPSLPITATLAELADNPILTAEQRARVDDARRALEIACDVATRWGYDDHAELRMRIFTDAAAQQDLVGVKRIEMCLALDALCRALGIPLEGPLGASAEAC